MEEDINKNEVNSSINNNETNNNMNNQKNLTEKKIINNNQNKAVTSDTIKILSLLKSYPSVVTSSSLQNENNQNFNSLKNVNTDIKNNNNDNNYTDNLSYEEIKAICLKIFMIYATPINGQFFLYKRYIFQILKEMEILSENCITNVDLEILNQQINKKGDKLNSEQFLDLLAKICCLLDENFYRDKKGSFIKLIKLYIIPYLQKMNKHENSNENENEISNINNDSGINNSHHLIKSYIKNENINYNLNFKDLISNEYQLDKDSYDVLMSIIEGLKIIYITYFSLSELSINKDNSKIFKESFNKFIKFLRDFEIIPYLIKQRLAELYWSIIISFDLNELYKNNKDENKQDNNEFNSLLNNKKYDIGKVYTFKKFFLLLSHISFYYYYPIKTKTQGQKLLYIIEKVYKSKGYENMPNIYSKTFNKKYTIIPPILIVERITKNILEKKYLYNMYNVCHSNLKEEKDYKEIFKDFIELNDENYNLLEKYVEQLKNIFDIYCHIFDRYQFGKISYSNLQKMLFDGQILSINNNTKNKELTKYSQNKMSNFEDYKVNTSNIIKEGGLNSTAKKNDISYSEEVSKSNKEPLNQSDLKKNNNKYSNNKGNISDNNVLVKINMSEIKDVQSRNSSQFDNKKLNSNLQSTQSMNNQNKRKHTKPKLKFTDLNIIVASLCGNSNLTEYEYLFKNNIDTSILNKPIDLIIFSDISSAKVNKSYKLDFIQFLKALTLIAFKMYPNDQNDINISMKHFLNNEMEGFLLNLNRKSMDYSQNNEYNNLFQSISSNEELIKLINDITPLIKGYFHFYSENIEQKERLCSFNPFLHFFKDYEIYPNWINLLNLSEIFYTQIDRINKENNNIIKNIEKLNLSQFLECFVVVGLTINSGNDLDKIDKVLFMIDKIFSDNYGKTIKKIKSLPSFKEDYFYFEKILKEKYPSYYEKKYSNCSHRYDNKFYWVYEKNYAGNQQIDFGELFNKEKVKFDDVFDDINNTDNKSKTYKNNTTINEMKEE